MFKSSKCVIVFWLLLVDVVGLDETLTLIMTIISKKSIMTDDSDSDSNSDEQIVLLLASVILR